MAPGLGRTACLCQIAMVVVMVAVARGDRSRGGHSRYRRGVMAVVVRS